jgi:ATP-dependent RNA helicase RhlE
MASRPISPEQKENCMSFEILGLAAPITRAIAEERYSAPTPIQAQAIPPVLLGRDLIGIAQTGTGKTAAFALPILHQLTSRPARPEAKSVRVLVLTPTRELASQIVDSFQTYGRHLPVSVRIAIGGVPIGKQIRGLAGGADVLVATPGRLMDLHRSRAVRLDRVEILVLDEADRMLDMGFIRDIDTIVAMLPKKRQTLFFSATMPPEIARLADGMLTNPAKVAVTPVASTAERVEQRIAYVDRARKPDLLAEILRREPVDRALIFTRTKHGADKVVRGLVKAGIAAEAIHGNKSQGQRERVLAGFRQGRVRTLVATDIAARGIDVDGISHVVNFDLPQVAETYVHRIGRTARAGKAGIAISLCSADELPLLKAIERLIRQEIAVTEGERPSRAAEPRKARPADARNARPPEGRSRRPAKGGGQPKGGGQRRHGGRPRYEPALRGDDISTVAFMRTAPGPCGSGDTNPA